MLGGMEGHEMEFINKLLGGDKHTIDEFFSRAAEDALKVLNPELLKDLLSEVAFHHFNTIVPNINTFLEIMDGVEKSQDLINNCKSLESLKNKFKRIHIMKEDILRYRISQDVKDIFTSLFNLIDKLYNYLEIEKTDLNRFRFLSTCDNRIFENIGALIVSLSGRLKILIRLAIEYSERDQDPEMKHVRILEGDWDDTFVNSLAQYFTTEILQDFPKGKRFRVTISEVTENE